MQTDWWDHKERGTGFALSIIVWIISHLGYFGRSLGQLVLYPICLYFMLFSPASVRASRQFLGKVWNHPPSWRDVFRHHHVFAATLLDRLHLLVGGPTRLSFVVHGFEQLSELIEAGRSCIVLGSHLGSFEAMRALAGHRDVPVKVLMHLDDASAFQRLDARFNLEFAECIIEIGRPDTLLKVREALEAGVCVGILGDRLFRSQRGVVCEFMGEPAQFPIGPHRLAQLLDTPIVMFFSLYAGRGRYDIYFERLADVQTRPSHHVSCAGQVVAYANRLEHYARLSPFNWFNFYDFWKRSKR